MGDDHEGSGGMEVKITDRMEDPPQELIPVIEEDSDDIPILEENQDPIPIPPPHIGNTENIEIIKMASCQGHSSLDAPNELNPPQRIPSLFGTPLVPQAEG